MLQALYNCRMSELYTIMRLGWNSCHVYLTNFSAFSAAYTAPLIASRLAAIDAAEALLDFQARSASQELARVVLVDSTPTLLSLFGQLKRYISYAYPANDWVIQWDAAGQGYYNEAAAYNWDSMGQMLNSMALFVSANSVTLLANNNMPAGWEANFLGVKASFDANHIAYESERQMTQVATEMKVQANNNCYVDMIAMFQDARFIGLTDAEKKQFVFANLLQLVSGAGMSGLKGTVTDAATLGTGVGGAVIDIVNLGISAVTAPDGTYSISGVPAGNYNIEVSAAGYQTLVTTATVNLGTISTIDFQLFI